MRVCVKLFDLLVLLYSQIFDYNSSSNHQYWSVCTVHVRACACVRVRALIRSYRCYDFICLVCYSLDSNFCYDDGIGKSSVTINNDIIFEFQHIEMQKIIKNLHEFIWTYKKFNKQWSTSGNSSSSAKRNTHAHTNNSIWTRVWKRVHTRVSPHSNGCHGWIFCICCMYILGCVGVFVYIIIIYIRIILKRRNLLMKKKSGYLSVQDG